MITKESKTKRDILKKQNDMHVYHKKDMWKIVSIVLFYGAWDAYFTASWRACFQYRPDCNVPASKLAFQVGWL